MSASGAKSVQVPCTGSVLRFNPLIPGDDEVSFFEIWLFIRFHWCRSIVYYSEISWEPFPHKRPSVQTSCYFVDCFIVLNRILIGFQGYTDSPLDSPNDRQFACRWGCARGLLKGLDILGSLPLPQIRHVSFASCDSAMIFYALISFVLIIEWEHVRVLHMRRWGNFVAEGVQITCTRIRLVPAVKGITAN